MSVLKTYGTNWCVLASFIESDGCKNFSLLSSGTWDPLVRFNPVKNSDFLFAAIDIVGNVESSHNVRCREVLNLTVDDGVHQSRLSRTVTTAKTVSVTTLETHGGLVKQDFGTISKGELAVAEILAFLLVIKSEDSVSKSLGSLVEALLDDGGGNDLGRRGVQRVDEQGGVGVESGLPFVSFEVLSIGQLDGQRGDVGDDGILDFRLDAGILAVLDQRLSHCLTISSLGRGEVGAVRGALELADKTKSGDGAVYDATCLRIGNVVADLEKTREQLGQEGTNGVFVVDELGHVVNDDGGLTSDGSCTLVETTSQKGNHQGESGRVNFRDESGGSQELDSLGGLLDRVDQLLEVQEMKTRLRESTDALDQSRNETLDILVGDQLTQALKGSACCLLDIGLGVVD